MSTNPTFEVAKYAATLPYVTETVDSVGGLLADPLDLGRRLTEGLNTFLTATPQERSHWAAQARQREADEARERAAERDAAQQVPLTMDTLVARLDAESGWDRAYLEHLVQPYCRCGNDIDGWSYCKHARDLGLAG